MCRREPAVVPALLDAPERGRFYITEVCAQHERSQSSARHTELGELCGNGLAVSGGPDMLVDVRNPAVGANIERPPGRERLIRIDHPVGARDRLRRIAEERIVHAE